MIVSDKTTIQSIKASGGGKYSRVVGDDGLIGVLARVGFDREVAVEVVAGAHGDLRLGG